MARRVEGPGYRRGVLQQVGLDNMQHDFTCRFITENGVLPCSCRRAFAPESEWWFAWKRWSAVRVNPGWWARHREGPDWPIQVTQYSCWISGWDD